MSRPARFCTSAHGWRRMVTVFAPAILVAATLAVMVPAVVAPSAASADTTQAGCAGTDPFTPALAAQLAARWPSQRFTASVYDERTGCQYDLNPGLRVTTASVLKVEVMAGILLRAQSQGRALTAAENSLIYPMITQSQDGPTDQLWQSLGGVAGMNNLDNVFGLGATTQAGPVWGLTVTSARDQVRLLRQVLVGDFGPLASAYRADAYNYMANVTPSQRWGIGAGLPSGWSFANKNGFASSTCCAWRINSTGVVYSPGGPAYTIAILSDQWPNQPAGIAGVETVGRAVAAALTGSSLPRPVLGRKSDGSLEMFATSGGRLLTSWQAGPGQPFGGWLDMGVPAVATGVPAVAGEHNGGLQVFVRTSRGRLLTSWQAGPAAPFGGWLDVGLPGQMLGDPAVAVTPAGAMSLFVVFTGAPPRGHVATSWQSGPDQPFGGWLDMQSLQQSAVGVPAAAVLANGGLQVFLHTGDNSLVTSWQPGPSQPFGGWLRLGADNLVTGDPSVAVSGTGAMSVVVAGTGGRVLTSWQPAAAGAFGGWLDLGLPATVVGTSAVAMESTGGLEVFAATTDRRLLTAWQSAATAPFGGWLDLGADGSIGSDAGVGVGSGGALGVVVRSSSGSTLTALQRGPSQPFTGFVDLAMPH
jgi:hypothetical protein